MRIRTFGPGHSGRRLRRIPMMIGTAAVSLVLVVGCGEDGGGGGGSGGGAGKVIKLGSSGPRTGPNVAVFDLWQATDACLKNANDKGGVNGYTFEYTILDDQYDPALTVGNTRRLVDEQQVLALVGSSGTAGTLATKDYVAAKGVPNIAHHSSAPATASPMNFAIQQAGINAGAAQAKFLIDEGHAEGGLGILYQNDDLGKPVREGAEYIARETGTKFTPIGIQQASRDLTPQLSRMKNSGATAVIISGVPVVFPTIIRAAESIGYRPKWIAVAYAAIPGVLKQLPAAQKENMFFDWYAAFPGMEGTQEIVDAMKKHYPSVNPPSANWTEGWVSCSVFLRAFERATEGGKEPTREGLLAALNAFENESWPFYKGLTYAEKPGVEEPHLPRPQSVVGRWNDEKETVELERDFAEVPKVPGAPTQ